jgi:hypothetical protein
MTTESLKSASDSRENVELNLWSIAELEDVEKDAVPSPHTSVRVGAILYSSIPIDELLSRLSRFKRLVKVVVADDRVLDRDMPSVEKAFKNAFPTAQFEWAFDGLISGKHGR